MADGVVAWRRALALLGLLAVAAPGLVQAQLTGYVPPSSELIPMGTTKGQRYHRLIIKNAMIIDGRGSPRANRGMPAQGPVDLIIDDSVITDMILVDPVNRDRDFQHPSGDRVIDAAGMYVIPGLAEMHAHLPPPAATGESAEYAYRLYLGHGVTTVRDAGTGGGMERMAEQRRLSEANEIVAPRLVLCLRWTQPLKRWDIGNNPEAARVMVRQFKQRGADCVKISRSPGQYPDVFAAAVDEGKKLGMFTMTDLKVSETDAVVASNAGAASIEHWYGVPDAALVGTQEFPPDYNYWHELDRFRWAGDLWRQADRHRDRLRAALDTLIQNGTNWDPTMTVYESERDIWRSMTQPWFETLALPQVIAAARQPDSTKHGGYRYEWKTSDEVRWHQNFEIWMKWVKAFHELGGLLTAGSDAGATGGIMLIRELELMQEAGINPIDIIRIATTNASKVLGWDKHCGIRVGCIADIAIVNGNPLDNFKVMYGRGYGFYGMVPRDEQAKHGGVIWTIKSGIVFDAQALLREVEWYVQQERHRAAAQDGRE
jgi:hypothetical protein